MFLRKNKQIIDLFQIIISYLIYTTTSWEPEIKRWINWEHHSHGEIRRGLPDNKTVKNQANFILADSFECSEELQHSDMRVMGQNDEEQIIYTGLSQKTCLKRWGGINTQNYIKAHITNIISVRTYNRGKFLFSAPQDECKDKVGTDMRKTWDYNWVLFLILYHWI